MLADCLAHARRARRRAPGRRRDADRRRRHRAGQRVRRPDGQRRRLGGARARGERRAAASSSGGCRCTALYAEQVKGTYADLQNALEPTARAHPIQGAEFLHRFAGDVPWAHLDIAGVSDNVSRPYFRQGRHRLRRAPARRAGPRAERLTAPCGAAAALWLVLFAAYATALGPARRRGRGPRRAGGAHPARDAVDRPRRRPRPARRLRRARLARRLRRRAGARSAARARAACRAAGHRLPAAAARPAYALGGRHRRRAASSRRSPRWPSCSPRRSAAGSCPSRGRRRGALAVGLSPPALVAATTIAPEAAGAALLAGAAAAGPARPRRAARAATRASGARLLLGARAVAGGQARGAGRGHRARPRRAGCAGARAGWPASSRSRSSLFSAVLVRHGQRTASTAG